MDAWEILRDLYKRHGAKKIAAALGLALSHLHKWARPGRNGQGEVPSPLDRVAALIKFTQDIPLVQWLCGLAGGFFVRNPQPKAAAPQLVSAEGEMIRSTADRLKAVADASQKGHITPEDAAAIRARWEEEKSVMEGFVLACERGVFRCGAFFLSLGWWLASGEVPMLAEAV